jgi:hypothetical protein
MPRPRAAQPTAAYPLQWPAGKPDWLGVTVKAAGALHLPGETLRVAIRSNGRSHRGPG